MRVHETHLSAARAHLVRCDLCEHHCHANRQATGVGKTPDGRRPPCGTGSAARVYRHRLEYGEESQIVPSLEVYLSGCDLRCAFCIAGLDAFDASRGKALTGARLSSILSKARYQPGPAVRTLQFVGGEPTVSLPGVIQALADCHEPLPPGGIVWKSDFCFTPSAWQIIADVADCYIADFKFGNDACAARIAGVRDYSYVEVLRRNLKLAFAETRLRAKGHKSLIVRHLLMPGHEHCCFDPVARWVAQELPGVLFSLRDGYLPAWRAGAAKEKISERFAELGRVLRRGEAESARGKAESIGLNLVH